MNGRIVASSLEIYTSWTIFQTNLKVILLKIKLPKVEVLPISSFTILTIKTLKIFFAKNLLIEYLNMLFILEKFSLFSYVLKLVCQVLI